MLSAVIPQSDYKSVLFQHDDSAMFGLICAARQTERMQGMTYVAMRSALSGFPLCEHKGAGPGHTAGAHFTAEPAAATRCTCAPVSLPVDTRYDAVSELRARVALL